MRAVCVYDDHIKPNVFIRNIIGDKSFGEVILKRVSVREKGLAFLRRQDGVDSVLEFSHPWELDMLLGKVRECARGGVIMHLFSDFVVDDECAAGTLIRKLMYAEGNYVCTCGGVPMLLVMAVPEEYCAFVGAHSGFLQDMGIYTDPSGPRFDTLSTDAFFHIGEYESFLRYISGGFDVRFFNSVEGDEYTVVKSSDNRAKIRAEYRFYHMLPDDMKMWFVMPYDYREGPGVASYRMERYHVPDLAIRWVHGAISLDEMERLLGRVFHFINTRKTREVPPDEYRRTRDALYLEKVRDRIGQLKAHALYPRLEGFLTAGCGGMGGLEGLEGRYEEVYRKGCSVTDGMGISVIGHGDLCFSNMLYNRDANLLKLIDPKGAEEEGQMWTDPYYDVAKLSHSICGLYDFFNSGLHQIVLDSGLQFRLEIDFDNSRYKEIFRRYAEESGYAYPLVRLYEASLFLSMLPLHMDNPQKVFGFVLNAAGILEEVEKCLNS